MNEMKKKNAIESIINNLVQPEERIYKVDYRSFKTKLEENKGKKNEK